MEPIAFGTILRHYRQANQYSVNELTDILKKDYGMAISPKSVYSWENGQSKPTVDTFIILCKLYGINHILDTFGIAANKEQPPLILNEEERQIILKYRSRKYCNSAIRKLLDIED